MPALPYIGEIALLGFNFAPIGWARCDGSLLPISQYDALFALIGTTYGGDGQTTFAVPDLRGRVPVHQGTGPGLPNYVLGQVAGQSSVTLAAAQMPSHSHAVTGSVSQAAAAGPGTTAAPGGNVPAGSNSGENYAAAASANGNLAPMQFTGSLQAAGGNQPFDNMPPYLAFNFCIAVEGIFPSPS